MKNSILLVFLLCISFSCFGQKKITWNDLAKVRFSERYIEEFDEYFLHPTFSKSLKELEGKKVSIIGYFLDIDPEGIIYALSKNPMATCFFCGGGGPETVIELRFSNKKDIKTDAIIEVTGTFKLNDTDIEHFNYIMTDCKIKKLN